MAKHQKHLDELFHEGLKDIYFAEKQLLGALPKMAKAARDEKVKAAFERHATETEEQVGRLEKVFAMIDKEPRGKKCPAIIGIVEEGQELFKITRARPPSMPGFGAGQAAEHYEIARYGTLKAWAAQLGLHDAIPLLDKTLAEENRTDIKLSELAESSSNRKAEAA